MSEMCLGKETYQNLMNPKPYGAHWVKDAQTKANHLSDWVECGGSANLDDGYELKSGMSHKEFFDGLSAHRMNIRRCMAIKGYTWIEECDGRCL